MAWYALRREADGFGRVSHPDSTFVKAMNRTNNNGPKSQQPSPRVHPADKENQQPSARVASANKEKKPPRTVARPGKPTGKHSELLREATENHFVVKTQDLLDSGRQTAKNLLGDPEGLGLVKQVLLSAGLVLQHDRGRDTLSTVPVRNFFEPHTAAQHLHPDELLSRSLLLKNGISVHKELMDIIDYANAGGKRVKQADVARAEDAKDVLEALIMKPETIGSRLGPEPGVLEYVTNAATHLGISLVYIPDRDTALPVKVRNVLALLPDDVNDQ